MLSPSSLRLSLPFLALCAMASVAACSGSSEPVTGGGEDGGVSSSSGGSSSSSSSGGKSSSSGSSSSSSSGSSSGSTGSSSGNVGGSSSGSSSSSSSGSSSSSSSSSSGGNNTDCASTPGLVWKTGSETVFESYPPPGSAECIQFSGCQYEGQFQDCTNTMPQSWVQSHNIVSVFPDTASLGLHNLCLKDPNTGNSIMVVAVDTCADSDCSGCCTQNQGSADELIDVEINTDGRFMNMGVDGSADIMWADMGPSDPSEIAGCN